MRLAVLFVNTVFNPVIIFLNLHRNLIVKHYVPGQDHVLQILGLSLLACSIGSKVLFQVLNSNSMIFPLVFGLRLFCHFLTFPLLSTWSNNLTTILSYEHSIFPVLVQSFYCSPCKSAIAPLVVSECMITNSLRLNYQILIFDVRQGDVRSSGRTCDREFSQCHKSIVCPR